MADASDPYIGKMLGSFRIEKQLGSGAMGVVYLGLHEPSGKKVAIKILPKEMVGKGQMTERFHREANLLQQFKHPNIVRFQAFGRNLGTLYVAMELVEGGTLDQLIEREAPLDWRKACQFAVEICDALQYAHEREVVHRDLKPSNLLISREGVLKLSDFGIAKDLVGTELTATGKTLGTAAYMAPEQISGTPAVSHKTDIYALGVIMHQLVCKCLPYDATTQAAILTAHLNVAPRRLSQKNPEIPLILDDLVHEMLSKVPTDRPWDALAIATRLRELLANEAAGKAIKYVVKPGVNPTRAGIADLPKAVKKAAPAKATSWKKRLEVVGLLAALGLLVGFIGYIVKPAGAEYLHDKAAALMASPEYSDWNQAMSRYVEPLEKRFPQHAYQDEVRGWKEKVALTRAERRADILDKSTISALARPDGPAEELYVKARERAADDFKAHNLPAIAGHWIRLGEALKPLAEKSPDALGWLLLAEKRERVAREDWLAQARPVVEKKLNWLKARQIGSPADEEETRKALENVLSESRIWPGMKPEAVPVEAKFEPQMPVQPPANPM